MATLQTQDPNSIFYFFAAMYDAVSRVWNAFEIRQYDILINFNDLKPLELGEQFYSKEQFSILFRAAMKLIIIFRNIFMLIIIIYYIYSA